jgi:ribonucleoside-diphosphate reductase alpha chain
MKEDLTYCTGANVSLWITDDFMKAVKEGRGYKLQWPVDSEDPKHSEIVDARELWKTICTSAWKVAEPGILNYDTIVNNLPAHCYEDYKVSCVNPCLSGDSWIFTSDGPRQINELVGKEFKATINGSCYASTDSGFFSTGEKTIYLVETAKGFSIKATSNHRFKKVTLSRSKRECSWVELSKLQEGDYLSLCNERSVEWEGYGSFELGWLLGSLKGDGNLTEDRANLDYWGDNKFYMMDYAAQCIYKAGLPYRSDLGSSLGQEKYNRVRLSSASLFKVAHELEMLKENNKKVSSLIEKTSSTFHEGFIRGWFDADGSVQGTQEKGISVRLGSVDLEGLKVIQRMLARLGIISSIYQNRKLDGYRDLPDGKGGSASFYCQANHELVIANDNLFLFQERIGFTDLKKQERLETLLASYKRTPNREKFADKIVSITELGVEPVFDCTIPDISSFNANGLEAHNCSEISLSDFDACRLISICLLNFVNNSFSDEASFDFEKFEKFVRITVRMGEALVCTENIQIEKIIETLKQERDSAKEVRKGEFDLEIDLWENVLKKGEEGRRIGLGDHGWGDMFAQLQLKYDSEEALQLAEKIKECYRDAAYDESCEIAKEIEPFRVFDWEKEKDCEFIKRLPKALKTKLKKFGRRHVSLLTNAPTGTLSILSQCSSGIEPTFRQMYIRRRKINPNDVGSRVDFVGEDGEKFMEFPQFEKNVERYFSSQGLIPPTEVKSDEDLQKHLPDYFLTSDQINWKKRIELQSVLTKYVDHSISSTINLPSGVSVEEVEELYMHAWEKGLKGVTVYREGSRDGVLISKETLNKQKEKDIIQRAEAPDRPAKLPCEVHFAKVRGDEYVIIIGLLKGTVYEVFFGKYGNQIPKKQFHGFVEQVPLKSRNKYLLTYIDDIEIKQVDINKYFDNKDYAAATRLISTALRHGTPLETVIDQLQKSSPSIVEYGAAISRVLKKYISIEDLQKSIKTCEHCESSDIEIKHEDGCHAVICKTCGVVDSKCG